MVKSEHPQKKYAVKSKIVLSAPKKHFANCPQHYLGGDLQMVGESKIMGRPESLDTEKVALLHATSGYQLNRQTSTHLRSDWTNVEKLNNESKGYLEK